MGKTFERAEPIIFKFEKHLNFTSYLVIFGTQQVAVIIPPATWKLGIVIAPVCLSVCVSVRLSVEYLEQYSMDFNQIWWRCSLSPKEDPNKFWASKVNGQGHSERPKFWPNVKR
jgi:hypothetical protein